jgi:hypothetical protein
MESPNIKLLDKLVKQHYDAYLKLNDDNVPILTELYDFETIRTSYENYANKKIKFEMISDKPILLKLNGTANSLKLINNQLLTTIPPDFKNVSVSEQIDYILLLEQLTNGNSYEIIEMIKDIIFDSEVYLELIYYDINHMTYGINISDDDIIKLFLSKYGIFYNDNYNGYNKNQRFCEDGEKCEARHNLSHRCSQRHEKIVITNEIKNGFTEDLEYYGILFLGNFRKIVKNEFDNTASTNITYNDNIITIYGYNGYGYEHKILIDDFLYDIIMIDGDYIFAHNPHKYEVNYHKNNKISDELTIMFGDESLIIKHLMIFVPFVCPYEICEQDDELYHWHSKREISYYYSDDDDYDDY